MKIFASEFGHSYSTYSFAYALYGELENHDALHDVYSKGFLPYSGSKTDSLLFYMARSVRSRIKEWVLTSENKRVLKLFDGKFEKKIKTLSEIKEDETFFTLALSYFNLAHGDAMPKERLRYILETNLITTVIEYSENGTPVAYILLVEDKEMSHYWFSFYDHKYMKTSLGMWLALDHIRDLTTSSKTYFYFGTCYQEKALYKTNVEPLEYWDGRAWNDDVKKLKALCRSDSTRVLDEHYDLFKKDLKRF